MHDEIALVRKLEPSRQVAPSATHAFGHGIEFAAVERKQGYDAVGLAELPSAQHDAARLIGARVRQGAQIPVAE
jgi:hypothetical protein